MLIALTMTIMKIVGMFTDKSTDYYVALGNNLYSYRYINTEQKLTANDYYMDVLGLTVTFALYGDLLGIQKWDPSKSNTKTDKAADKKIEQVDNMKKDDDDL